MATAVARSRSPGSQRPPRKKHSFLSLHTHRDKSVDARFEQISSPPRQPGYFDLYPARAEPKSKRDGTKAKGREGEVIAFPSVSDRMEDLHLTPQAPRHRLRSNTSPSHDPQLPPLRLSGSSAFSHSPPATPTLTSPPDDLNLATANPLRYLMSAPVVETTAMDAFVDGMNGGEEDVFASIDALRGGRRRKKSTSSANGFHHPLYHPPLPTPPPGIKLGGPVIRTSGDSDADDDSDGADDTVRLPPRPHSGSTRPPSTNNNTPSRTSRNRRPQQQLPSPPASVSPPSRQPNSTKGHFSPSPAGEIMDTNASIDEIVRRFVSVNDTPPKQVVPSISDIIRTHTPEQSYKRHKPSLSITTPSSPSPIPEDHRRRSQDDRSDILARSSIDSIAEEVQRSLRIAREHPATALHHARSFPHVPATDQHASSSNSQGSTGIRSRRSEGGYRTPSISSFTTSAHTAPATSYAPVGPGPLNLKSDPKQALATFLRSSRLTKLIKLKRPPNQRLQVSFSDLGSSSGRPVVVFLGLGCVRYIMGLYDEMAEALGLRLITIDRWGLGRTDNPSKNTPRGVMEWASVVEEVLDHLKIKRCSIMAHSAGAPYAMAFANRNAERVQGDLCLLAPWVGAGEGASGYKWLKYVPTGIIKTAQAAEWRVQAWMLGKPPTITYTGIGYNLSSPVSCSPMDGNTGTPNLEASPHLKELKEAEPGLNSFSDYDDLADFQGNYASRSTVHINEGDSAVNTPPPVPAIPRNRARSKSNRFFGGLWKSNDVSNPSPTSARGSPRLKALKSMSSLRGSAASRASSRTQQPQTASRASTGGTFESEWTRLPLPASSPSSVSSVQPASEGTRGNARTRRSISLTSSVTSQYSRSAPFQSKGHHLSSPPTNSAFETSAGPNINAALGNALLAASHAESSRGAHADLLQILNLNQKPWGFSYGEFPHAVRVWYGDKDEKIADGAVKWMEKTMRPGTCEIRMIKGAGHGLLYNGGVVVEALEFLKETWYRK